MKKLICTVGISVAALGAGLVWAGPPVVDMEKPPHKIAPDAPRVPLQDAMRNVLADHGRWSRIVVMAVMDDLKGCEAYEDRLAQNGMELEGLLEPYYGETASKFGALFAQHLEITGQVLYAIRSDDKTLRSILPDWYANGDRIAGLLWKVNPENFPLEDMELMWRMHLDTILDTALAYHRNDWERDVLAYDALNGHCLTMADTLAAGIKKQFPKQ